MSAVTGQEGILSRLEVKVGGRGPRNRGETRTGQACHRRQI